MNNTANAKRYFVFSKKTFAKTGVAKPMRRAATRGEARAHKDGNVEWGIWDTQRNVAVR
jgi:hypothetical protein